MRRVKLTALLVACLLIHAAAVRAEDIVVTAPAAEGSGDARVLVVEPMGSETLLTLEYRGQRLVARVAGDSRFEPGQVVCLSLPPERTLTFDAGGSRIE